jgi:hypothetical protein
MFLLAHREDESLREKTRFPLVNQSFFETKSAVLKAMISQSRHVRRNVVTLTKHNFLILGDPILESDTGGFSWAHVGQPGRQRIELSYEG